MSTLMTRTCKICGKQFTQQIQTGQPRKYCSEECMIIGSRKVQREQRAQKRARRKAAKGMKDVEVGVLDKSLAEARSRGLSYAEWQVEQTLQRVRRGEL